MVEKYVHKGDKLYVEGRIRYRSYDDQKGIKQYVTEIYADNMEMLSPRQNSPAEQPTMVSESPVQPEDSDRLPF